MQNTAERLGNIVLTIGSSRILAGADAARHPDPDASEARFIDTLAHRIHQTDGYGAWNVSIFTQSGKDQTLSVLMDTDDKAREAEARGMVLDAIEAVIKEGGYFIYE